MPFVHRHRRIHQLSTCLFLLVAVCAPAFGQSFYLSSRIPDGVVLLPPPPPLGSVEEAADLACVRSVSKSRSVELEAQATMSSGLSFNLFAPALGPSFDLTKLHKTDALLQRVKKEIGPIIDASKDHFRRLRPYQIDPELSVGKPEPSFGYPSGHSTRGTVYALVLAELFPEHKDAVLAVGREIGWHRVIIAKHFPTDIYAGRVLGQAIVQALLTSPSFQHDLAEARTEMADPAQPARQGAAAISK